MADGLWIWIVIIGAIWLFWPRSKASSAETLATFPEPVGSPKPQKEASAEELEVENARRAREQVERDEEVALQSHHESMNSVRQKIERARKYLKDTGLDRTIPEAWDMTQHWPSWVTKPDQWKPPAGITNIEGGGSFQDSRVEFKSKDHTYSMHFVEKHNYVPDDYDRLGEITLEVDGQIVCAISCARGVESYDSWRYSDVEALTVGPWMSEFVALTGQLRMENAASTRETFGDFERERADRINLGE